VSAHERFEPLAIATTHQPAPGSAIGTARYRPGCAAQPTGESPWCGSPPREAFGYLARRYDLEPQGVLGLSPDAEPDVARIAQLTDLLKKDHVKVVFTSLDTNLAKLHDALDCKG
jgi:hypothetical protein